MAPFEADRSDGMTRGGRALHQLIATLAPYDAVSSEALAMREALRDSGRRSELFAEHTTPEMAGEALPLSELQLEDGDGLLLHYSVWSAAVERALAERATLLVRYHNVTPAHWFEGVNETVVGLCRKARAGLADLAPRTKLAIADSSFNREDLEAAGYARTAVLPILLAPSRSGPAPRSRDRGDPLILTVGRIAPNKRIDDVLRVFALFQRACRPGASLHIVGSGEGFEPYEHACRRLAVRLGARDVNFAGSIDDREKESLLADASAYVCLSEHEGFCVPVVEAMRHGLPILARAAGAVPETLGTGGLAVDTRDHAELAELLDLVACDWELRATIQAAQEKELRRFEPTLLRKRFEALIAEAIP